MSLLRFNRQFAQRLLETRHYSSILTNEDEYTASPQYPPILDVSLDKVRERKKEEEYEQIKAVKTVEEKQIKINMPKYYGFKCYMLYEDKIPYNNLPLVQHITRTHLVHSATLPESYNSIDVDGDLDYLKSEIEEAILFGLDGYRQVFDIKREEISKAETENILSFTLSKQINRLLLSNLSKRYPHLKDVQVDIKSRIESFWFSGGMNPPEHIRRCRKGTPWQKDKIDEPTNRAMNYIGTADIALRADKPLLPIVSASEAENPDLEVPFYKLDPRTVVTTTEHRHIANVPGFWPGDPRQFGMLSYHGRGHIAMRHYNDPIDDEEALHRQAILSSFGWLNAQANFLGFNTFNDITYPLVTQTIITNGKLWSFYLYQLNTLLNHSKYVTENPKRNICWALPEMKLFEDLADGKLIGFNDEVLKNLLKLYSNTPALRLGIDLKPYLSHEEKVSADYADDEKREWLEREYKFLVSNRPRWRLPYEIYTWEKIYKIDHQTRFMDKKRRPFELKTKPFNRRLDERKPKYIPRALRPHLPKNKGRDAKEYFP